MSEAQPQKDFFISYTAVNREWAEWIAWELEEAGYTTVLQAWDFGAGSNFMVEMRDAARDATRTIAVLSSGYEGSGYSTAEWTDRLGLDPTSKKGLLVTVRVEDYDPGPLLRNIVYIDLVGLTEEQARERLLAKVKQQRAKPAKRPRYPSEDRKAPLFPGEAGGSKDTTNGPLIFNLPRQNPNFTGRKKALKQIHNALKGKKLVAITAIYGLGGVGKSQLAIEYAHEHAEGYSLVWWVRSETDESLSADFEELARALGLVAGESGVEQKQAVQLVLQELGRRDGWLVVFDNAPSPDAVKDYLPPENHGRVIVTSRYLAWGEVASPMEVDVLSPAESVRLLLSRTKQKDKAAAGELAEELGRLPLALEHAAAYMERTGLSCLGYLELFRKEQIKLLQEGLGADGKPTVTTTWEISFERVRAIFPPAADLLNLCAFLAPDDIPLDVIVEGAGELPESLAAAVRDSLELNRAVALLRAHSLITSESEQAGRRALAVHRLLQAVTRDRLGPEERETWLDASANVINAAFPKDADKPQHWPQCDRLSAHAAQVATHAEEAQSSLEPASRLLNQMGTYTLGRAELRRSKSYLERALEIGEKVYSPDHPSGRWGSTRRSMAPTIPPWPFAPTTSG